MSMNFQCPSAFDLTAFMAACVAATPSVVLEAGGLPPDGFLVYQNGVLSVTLNSPDDSKQAVVTSAAQAQGATPI